MTSALSGMVRVRRMPPATMPVLNLAVQRDPEVRRAGDGEVVTTTMSRLCRSGVPGDDASTDTVAVAACACGTLGGAGGAAIGLVVGGA